VVFPGKLYRFPSVPIPYVGAEGIGLTYANYRKDAMLLRVKFDGGRSILYHADSSRLSTFRKPKVSDNPRHTFFGSKSTTLAHHGVKGMHWGVHNEETQQKYGEIAGGAGGVKEDDETDENEKNPDSPDYVPKDKDINVVEGKPGEVAYYVNESVEKEGPFGIKYKDYNKRYLDSEKVESGYYKNHNIANTKIYSSYLEKDVDVSNLDATISQAGRDKLKKAGWIK
jgi:hypothetical protein